MSSKIKLSEGQVEDIRGFLSGSSCAPKIHGIEFSVNPNGERAVHVPGLGNIAWTTKCGAMMAQARYFRLLPYFDDWVTQWQGFSTDDGGMVLTGSKGGTKGGTRTIGPSDPVGFYNGSGGNLNPLMDPSAGKYYIVNDPPTKEPPKDDKPGNSGEGQAANQGDGGDEAEGDDDGDDCDGGSDDDGDSPAGGEDEKSKSLAYSEGGSEGQSEGKGKKGKGNGSGDGKGKGNGGGSDEMKNKIGRAFFFSGPGSKEWSEKMGAVAGNPEMLDRANKMMEKFGICNGDVGTLISITPNRAMFQLWKDCRFITMPLRNPLVALPDEYLVEQEKKRYPNVENIKFKKGIFNRSKLPKPGYRYLARGERLNPETDVWGDGFKDNLSATPEEQNKQEIIGPCNDRPHYPFSLYARKVDMVSSGSDGIIRFDGLEFDAVLVQDDGSEVALTR